MRSTDTIAAIASGMTASGIGIIRISGPEAFAVSERICRLKNGKKLSEMKPNSVHYGFISSGKEEIDEALILLMRAPHTYTAEDTVEIDCHGGPYAMRKVLECALENGARMAEPGEFTKRAFLNGRIDLSEAEAVMDLIGAKNEAALKSSEANLRGSVRTEVTEIRGMLLRNLARIEASLDDPEQLSLEGYGKELRADLEKADARIVKMLKNYDGGKLAREGIRTVILGKPNTGKSTLLNLLTGEDRAIVTDIAGTTRDALEETVNLSGITLAVTDTAGIRKTNEPIEKIGVEKARRYAENADLILYVADSSVPLDENDREILKFLGGRKAIALLNKTDLEPAVSPEEIESRTEAPVLSISAKEGTGLDELTGKIKEMFFGGKLAFDGETILVNERQKEALSDAHESIGQTLKSIADGMPEDLWSIDLTDAYASLGKILGEEVGDDVINEIFSKFCMGK
jgi:tRNA modification GTPase